MSQLDQLRDLTFENFQPRGRVGLGGQQADSLQQSFDAAHAYAQTMDGWLLLQGKYGCGKTHLAAAIANFVLAAGIQPLFITVPDLLDSLRFTYQDPNASFEERFEKIRQSPLLIMDDFGTQSATPWAKEKLFQIINYRYINKLPLVVTTNLMLGEIEGRIRSRLEDKALTKHVYIEANDYRQHDDDFQHELSSLHLLMDRVFSNFDLRKKEDIPAENIKSLTTAFEGAKKYADKPKGWLVITGPYGSGKTHLAAAIANHQTAHGKSAIFLMVPDLMDHLKATFNPNSPITYDRRFEEIRTTPLLILDDLGTQSMTPWAKEKLYQLFNHRYNAKLPTVITTADALTELDERLRSRILDTRLCKIYATSVQAYTGK